jgi:hypothetical protein
VPLGDVIPTNGFWIDADIDAHGSIVFDGHSATDSFELYRVPADGGLPKALTHLNADLSDLILARQDTVTWKGPGEDVMAGVWKAAVAGAPVTDWVEMYDLSDGNVTQVTATRSPWMAIFPAIRYGRWTCTTVGRTGWCLT